MNYIKTTGYGRRVYRMNNDQADHYTTNINITAAFSMEAFTSLQGTKKKSDGKLGNIVVI